MNTSAINSLTDDFEVIDISTVNYIGFENRKVTYESDGGTHYQPITLKELTHLGLFPFARAALVNLNNYAEFHAKKSEFTFKSGVTCKVSGRYAVMLEMMLQNYTPVPLNWPMVAINAEGDVVELDMNTVDFVDLAGRVPVYNVGKQKYRHITLVEELECEALLSEGFEHLDRGSFVNLPRIKRYDRTEGLAYFNGGKAASVARIHSEMLDEMTASATVKSTDRRQLRMGFTPTAALYPST